MAFTCTEIDLPDEIKCLLPPCMGESQRIALQIYFLRLAFIALGGSEEEIDAVIDGSKARGMAVAQSQLSAALAALYAQLAVDLGAEPTAEEISETVACGACAPNGEIVALAVLCRVLALLSENCGRQ